MEVFFGDKHISKHACLVYTYNISFNQKGGSKIGVLQNSNSSVESVMDSE